MITIRCKAGDLVEVRSVDEVLATLDANGCFQGFPFQPEMLQYCGRQFRVHASAHKICDSTYYKEGRILEDAVFLEDLRCDGSAHDGCQAKCSFMFKLAWLKPVSPARNWRLPPSPAAVEKRDAAWLQATTRRLNADGEVIYRCQTTDYLDATVPYKPSNMEVLVADVRSGNVSLWQMLRAQLLLQLWLLTQRRVPPWSLWNGLYVRLHRLFYGTRSPHVNGSIPKGSPTPDIRTGLQAGDLVKVRSIEEVEPTLNVGNRNRGLSFNPEMSPYCGDTFRVERRVTRIIDERRFTMLEMKNPCIMLEGVVCKARYHPEAILCPKRVPQYFREAWLEKVDGRS